MISVKNCIKRYVSNFLKRFIFTREKNIRTTQDDNLYITAILFSVFIRTILYEQKTLILAQKIKNNKRATFALNIIRTKHQHRAWLSLILYCMYTSSTLNTLTQLILLMTTSYFTWLLYSVKEFKKFQQKKLSMFRHKVLSCALFQVRDF